MKDHLSLKFEIIISRNQKEVSQEGNCRSFFRHSSFYSRDLIAVVVNATC